MPIYKCTVAYALLDNLGAGWTRSVYHDTNDAAAAAFFNVAFSDLELNIMSSDAARTYGIVSDVAIQGDARVTTYDTTLPASKGKVASSSFPPNSCMLFTPRTILFTAPPLIVQRQARGYLRVHAVPVDYWTAGGGLEVPTFEADALKAGIVADCIHRWQPTPTVPAVYYDYVSVSGPQIATRRIGRPFDLRLLRA